MSLELPEGEAKIFASALGMAAVYVASFGGQRFAIRGAIDVSRSIGVLRAAGFHDAVVAAVYWFRGKGTAKRVAAAARDELAGDHAISLPVIEVAIVQAAAVVAVNYATHADMMARLNHSQVLFDTRLSEAKKAGCLQFFHEAFRERRLACAAAARPFPTYAQAEARMRRYLIAQHAPTRGLDIKRGELLAYVFGENRHD